MNKKFVFLFITVFLLQFCSGRFVIKEELSYFSEKYSGTYKIKKITDIGNNKKINPGEVVKIYFVSDSESIKVYAYLPSEPREKTLGKNILYLFDTDFPNEMYKREFLEMKLSEILEAQGGG
ncbi:MAG: type II secretion system-associated lipoprotein [Spirochaetia bacterium]|nr:type II secretion system-associated lipoprotein [Spirochaetia bacterium]